MKMTLFARPPQSDTDSSARRRPLDWLYSIIARRLARAMIREIAVAVDPDTGALLLVPASDLQAAPRSPATPVRSLQGRWLPRFVRDLQGDGGWPG